MRHHPPPLGGTDEARNRRALLVALGVDNLGSGLFLPLTLVFASSSVGLPLGLAGALVTAGTVVGLAAPPLTGRLVDRVGPRVVVAGSQLTQAAGLLAYLLASGPQLVALGAALVAAGTHGFYGALFALVADVAPAGQSSPPPAAAPALAPSAVRAVWHDRPFVGLIAVTALLGLASDVFLVGLPVYALRLLHAPAWVPGACLALLTALISLLAGRVVHATRTRTRAGVMGAGAACSAVWAGRAGAALWLPHPWVGAWLLGSTLVLAAGALLFGTRANAVAEASAPAASRGRHLAAFQYAYSGVALVAPLVVGLFAVAGWLPWLLVAAASCAGLAALPVLARHLPAARVRSGHADDEQRPIRGGTGTADDEQRPIRGGTGPLHPGWDVVRGSGRV